MCIWGTLFYESWKRKQTTINFYWNCHDNSYSQQDERTDDFKFYMHYNESTDYMNKEARTPKRTSKYILNILTFIINADVVNTMVLYFFMKERILSQKDDSGIDITKSLKNFSGLTHVQKKEVQDAV